MRKKKCQIRKQHKAADEEATLKKNADDNAKAKKAVEANRPEELTQHLNQPVYMLTQAEQQLLKGKPELETLSKLSYIPSLYY